MADASNGGGCLKVLLIAVPLVALAAFLFWKVSQASEEASAISDGVVVPYLDKVRAGQYAAALDSHGHDDFRKQVSADELEAAYAALVGKHGELVGHELVVAQEHHVIGGASKVQSKYKLVFENGQENVAYDIVGEGDQARISASYNRVAGGSLELVPR